MLAKAGDALSICSNDAGVVDEMEGVVVVWRTRFTSLRASSDQRSTLMTYMLWSISLGPGLGQRSVLLSGERKQATRGMMVMTTYLQSTSLPVWASVTIRRTQGGGVMGRRSWLASAPDRQSRRGRAHPRERRAGTYLVAKAAHPGALWLLHNIKSASASGQRPRWFGTEGLSWRRPGKTRAGWAYLKVRAPSLPTTGCRAFMVAACCSGVGVGLLSWAGVVGVGIWSWAPCCPP